MAASVCWPRLAAACSLALAAALAAATWWWAAVRSSSCATLAMPVSTDRSGMVWVPPGRFVMGSDHGFPEEAPAREVRVDGFWIADHEVTNAEFARFVEGTGYLTVAERKADGAFPGSAVFEPPARGQPGRWRFDPTANWRQPLGVGSDLRGMERHPVVHVALEDARRYAAWLGHQLPTEAQWEYAANGGQPGGGGFLGDAPGRMGRWRANTWQGRFPFRDTAQDGFALRAPVGCYPPNGYGLYDMIGNVWEWTGSRYRDGARAAEVRHAVKGGSFLCAPNYCRRYRASARQGQEAGLGAAHIGFRTVVNP